MAIPDGKLYMDGDLSAGTVATIEDAVVNTENAGAAIKFGTAVALNNGKVVTATKAPIYGVALKRSYINGDHYDEDTIKNDAWQQGEDLGVLRDGTVAVQVSQNVDRGENATVDSNGLFKPAGANDAVVGVFLSAGDKDGTANLQTRIQLSSNAASGGADPSTDGTHNAHPSSK